MPAVIEAEGLREPFEGRGVALSRAQDAHWAKAAARGAVLRERHEHDGDHGEGLLVFVDVSGLVGLDVPAGLVDRIGTVLVAQVPPDHIVGFQTFAVELPARGSWAERGELAGGFARRSRSLLALPTYDLVQRKPYALVPAVL